MRPEEVVALARTIEPGCQTKTRAQYDGWGVEIGFRNGYGADVACATGTYGSSEGLAETAVTGGFGGELVYNTPVINGVIGWQDIENVESTLRQIAALSAESVAEHNAALVELAERGPGVSRADAEALLAHIQEALQQSADGDVVYLGDFSKYLDA